MSSQITPPVPESSPRDRALFRVNPMSHLVSGILLLAVLGPISVRPAWFLWLLLLPLGFSWWVLRTRTRVDDDGVTLHSWRDSQTVSWDRVSGVMFPRRGFARLVTTDDTELALVNEGTAPARVLLYAGERQSVNLVSYGPFIGESEADIVRSIERYKAGTFRDYTS